MNKMRMIAALTGAVALTGLAGFSAAANAAPEPKSSGYLVGTSGGPYGAAASSGRDRDFVQTNVDFTVGPKYFRSETASVHTTADPVTGMSTAEASLAKVAMGFGPVKEFEIDAALAKCTAGPEGVTTGGGAGTAKIAVPGLVKVEKNVTEKLPDGGVSVDALRVTFGGHEFKAGHVECHPGVKPVDTPVISTSVGAGAAAVGAGAAGVFFLRRRRNAGEI
ncbi:hypothetical protein [Amycolatopsis sp. lyj-108]|uniref:hypothetical protein n=1 Tax=Amycolatopsis sp. lyj-108 TaxID=2789286 RepID=UPI003979E15F